MAEDGLETGLHILVPFFYTITLCSNPTIFYYLNIFSGCSEIFDVSWETVLYANLY